MSIRDLETKKDIFFNAIGVALAKREMSAEDCDYDGEYGVPKYVNRMCDTILVMIGRPELTTKDVLKVDRLAAGHSD